MQLNLNTCTANVKKPCIQVVSHACTCSPCLHLVYPFVAKVLKTAVSPTKGVHTLVCVCGQADMSPIIGDIIIGLGTRLVAHILYSSQATP